MTFTNIATGVVLSECDFYNLISGVIFDCCSQSQNVWIGQPNNLAFNEYQWQQWFIANPPSCGGTLTITYASPGDVPVQTLADWNAAISLSGANYTGLNVAGAVVSLTGGSNVILDNYIFSGAPIVSITDVGSIIEIGEGCVSFCNALVSASFDSVTSIGQYAFRYGDLLDNVSLPSCVSVEGNSSFERCYLLTSINLPACTSLGGTTGNNGVFEEITGQTITATLNAALATCNAGNPDGDIDYLTANNTVTVNYV